MANDKWIGKGVAIVTLGGVTNVLVEYAATKVSKASEPFGKASLDASDAAGTVLSLVEIAAGAAMKKHGLALFGAGSLAAAIATIVAKYFTAYNPLNASANANALRANTAPGSALMVGPPATSQPAYANVTNQLVVGPVVAGDPVAPGHISYTRPLGNDAVSSLAPQYANQMLFV